MGQARIPGSPADPVWDIATYDFDLPPGLIAARPANPRDSARLLHVGAGLADRTVRDLPRLLRPGDLLVVNDTKVIPAHLVGRRGAAKVEITLHRQDGVGIWRGLARPAKRLKPCDRVEFGGALSAEVLARNEGEVTLSFGLDDAAMRGALARHGAIPLPPYIPRDEGADARDLADYQTMFARAEGAVAAPTAGLHFTPALLDALAAAGIGRASVTLHVGPGTFLPVKTDDIRAHRMHSERATLTNETAEAINAARAKGGRIVAVGSTALRTLESAAAEDGMLCSYDGDTALFITPGYRFKAVDLMMTNFHLPRSTLFILVAAFGGLERMRAAYAHAIGQSYRFFSYGDACLIEPETAP
jgi:S-adenosylmethionine:tRNA ribosyltransferase-isomerase